MTRPTIIRRNDGFSLIELMITMAIFIMTITAASSIFTGLLSQFKQQSRIVESSTEKIIGLEIMRYDIEHAGYGLPWALGTATYQEAGIINQTPWIDRDFNDGPPINAGSHPVRGTDVAGASNPPGAIRGANGAVPGIGADVFMVKSTLVAEYPSRVTEKFTHLFTGNTATLWTTTPAPATSDNFNAGDRVIVLSTANETKTLVSSGGFTGIFSAANNLTVAGFASPDASEVRVVYGIADPDTTGTPALRMPFNRADYYIRRPGDGGTPAVTLPTRCATGTGVLMKSLISQVDGLIAGSEMPLIDCVADMEVVYLLDTNNDGTIDGNTNNLNNLTALQIRAQLKEVHVYVLAHEGQRDPSFDYTASTVVCGGFRCIPITDPVAGALRGLGFPISNFVTDWNQYRWKLYPLAVRLTSLR